MDSHSVFADPDPAVFLNADPDLALKLRNNLPYEEFAVVEKTKKDGSKVKNYGAGPYLLIKKKNYQHQFSFLLFLNFSLPDPDPGGKINADPDPQSWLLLKAFCLWPWNDPLLLWC